jgi:predicted nucleic acid-binding Zn ribbon protein
VSDRDDLQGDGLRDDDPQGVHNSPDSVNAGSSPDVEEDSASSALAPGALAPGKSGIELAREALAQAKADARKRGSVPGQGKRKGPRPVPVRDPGRGGDPKAFSSAIRELMASRGWEQRAAVGGVFGNWPGIVGPELAEHTRPEKFEDGELTVVADSTTWATQLRLLASTLVRRLNEELGHGTVRKVKVVGPSSGPRRPGAWRVR